MYDERRLLSSWAISRLRRPTAPARWAQSDALAQDHPGTQADSADRDLVGLLET